MVSRQGRGVCLYTNSTVNPCLIGALLPCGFVHSTRKAMKVLPLVGLILLSGCAMGPDYECKLGAACQTEYQAYMAGKNNHNPNAYSVIRQDKTADDNTTHDKVVATTASNSGTTHSVDGAPRYIQPKIAKTWIHAFVDQSGVVTDSHTISWIYREGHWQGVSHTKTINQSAVLSPMGGGNPANN